MKYFSKSLTYFSVGLSVFLADLKEFLTYARYQTLVVYVANIFSPHYSLTSHSPSGVFEWMEVLGLNVHSPVSQSFPFWLLLYVSSSRNLSLSQNCEDIHLYCKSFSYSI